MYKHILLWQADPHLTLLYFFSMCPSNTFQRELKWLKWHGWAVKNRTKPLAWSRLFLQVHKKVLQIWISLPCHEYIFGNPLSIFCPPKKTTIRRKRIKPELDCKAVLALSVHLRRGRKRERCDWLTDDSNKSKNKLAILLWWGHLRRDY